MKKVLLWLIPYAFLTLLVLLFFWRAVFNQELIVLGDFTGSDLLDLHLPFKYALHDAYTQGTAPLWSHYLANGFPLAAEGQSGPFYPPNILLAFVSPFLALNLSIVLAFLIAGWGAYTYARLLGMRTVSALWVGVIFMFSSFFIARIKHLNMIVVAAYLPWALYCARKSMQSRSYWWFVMLGVVWALELLAGHPHMAYLTLLMVLWHYCGEIAYLLLHEGKQAWKKIQRVMMGLILSGTLAIGLSAVQLLPTAELTVQSTRIHLTFEKAVGNPMRGKFLLSFLYPFFLGNPAEGTYKVDILHEGIWWENTLYIGLVPFVLALVFVLYKLRGRWGKYRRGGDWITLVMGWLKHLSFESFYLVLLAVGAVLFLSLSFGGYSLLYLVAFYVVPGMSLFRFPTRFNLYVILVVCLFSGWGFTYLIDRIKRWRWLQIGLTVLLFVVTLFDLYHFLDSYITYIPAQRYLVQSPAADVIKQNGLARVYPLTQYEINPYYLLGWKNGRAAIVSELDAIPGNNAIIQRVDSFSDRGWFEGGLAPQDRYNLEYHLLSTDKLRVGEWRGVFAAWNVRYFLSYSPLVNYSLKAEYPADPFFKNTLKLYENPDVLGRAYISHAISARSGFEDVISAMKQRGWDPKKEVFTLDTAQQVHRGVPGDDIVTFEHYSDSEVRMKAMAESDGVLVFSDAYYPGWHASVDGVEQSIFPVNLTQRAITLSQGTHEIRWWYAPLSFYSGLAISAISFILMAGYLLKKVI